MTFKKITIINPETRVPEHDRVLAALTSGSHLPELGICFISLDKDGQAPACIRLAVARWNFTGEVSIFNHDGLAAVIIGGRATINAHSNRRRTVWDNFDTPYDDLADRISAHIRSIHRR